MFLPLSQILLFLLFGKCFTKLCPSNCDDIPPDLFPQQLECDLIKATGQCTRPEIDTAIFCRCSCETCPIDKSEPSQNSTKSFYPIKVQKSKSEMRMEEIELMDRDMNTYIPYKHNKNLSRYDDLGRSVGSLEEFAPLQGPCSCYDEPPVGSTYTCLEMFMDDKCQVLLEYGFCECTCGKCAGQMQSILSDYNYPYQYDSELIQEPQMNVNVNQVDSIIETPSNNIGNGQGEILDDTQQIQDTFYSINDYGVNFTITEMTFDEPAVVASPIPNTNNMVAAKNNETQQISHSNIDVQVADLSSPFNFQNSNLDQSSVGVQIDGNNTHNNNATSRIISKDQNTQNFTFSYALVSRNGAPQVEVEQNEQLDQQEPKSIIIDDELPQTQQAQQKEEDLQSIYQKSTQTSTPSNPFFESSSYEDYLFPSTTLVLPQKNSLSSQQQTLVQSPQQLLPIAISQTQQSQILGDVDNLQLTQKTCVDIEPPNSQLRCAQLKQQGRCTQSWMQGFCEISCGVCINNEVYSSNFDVINSNDIYSMNTLVVPTSSQINTPVIGTSQLPLFTLDDFEEEPQNAICLSACNDNPPPKSDYTCIQQRNMGKCDRDWIKGYCECTCETCDAYFHTDRLPQQFMNYTSSQFQAPVWNSQIGTQSLEDDFFLTVLHFNDIHARVEPTTEQWWECEPWKNEQGDCFGGFARMKTIVDMERQIDPNLLLLDGGDDFVGSQWDYYDPANKATAHFFSLMGVDAITLGNHEFDHGPDVLVEHIQEAKYPFLSCNMDALEKPSLDEVTSKFVIKEVKGRKVGIFGLTTTYTNTAEAANPYPVWFNEPYQAARECIAELQNLDVDIIIALSHLGYSADRYLVREVNGIDLVIGAHSHSFLSNENDVPVLNLTTGQTDTPLGQYPTWEQSPDGKSVPVVQAGWASRYMGKIQIRFNQNGDVVAAQGYPILLGGSATGNLVLENQQFVQEIKNWKWW